MSDTIWCCFYGLVLKERIDIADGLAIVPFDQVRSFVDKKIVEDLAPRRSVFDGWRSVGAVARPFRWRPVFSRPGYQSDRDPTRPHRFFREAQVFLELLAVAQAAPVLSMVALGECIDRSAGRLLGLEDYCGNEYGRRSAERFDGFEECRGLSLEALDQARAAFENRRGERYAQVAPIVSRLAQALTRGEGFADEMRIVDVVIALENMYDLPRRDISATLQRRAARYLGTDSASKETHQGDRQAILQRTVEHRSRRAGQRLSAGNSRVVRQRIRHRQKDTVQAVARGPAE